MDKKNKHKDDESTLPNLALVLGYVAIKDLQRLEDRVRVLSQLGYDNQAIARICDTTPGTVAVRKAQLKRKSSRGEK